IDEVHMLTRDAFNALLKTLEEPPPHVLFLFATTEPHKIPVTILSRCQRFDFKRAPQEILQQHLMRIAERESMKISERALAMVARSAEGGVRDAMSLMDQIIAFGGTELEDDQVAQAIGAVNRTLLMDLLQALLQRDVLSCMRYVEQVFVHAYDLRLFTQDLASLLRDATILCLCEEPGDIVELTPEEHRQLQVLLKPEHSDRLQQMFRLLVDASTEIAQSASPRLLLEMTLIRMVRVEPVRSLEDVLQQLGELEQRLIEGLLVEDDEADAQFVSGNTQMAQNTTLHPVAEVPEHVQVQNTEMLERVQAPNAEISECAQKQTPDQATILSDISMSSLDLVRPTSTIQLEKSSQFAGQILSSQPDKPSPLAGILATQLEKPSQDSEQEQASSLVEPAWTTEITKGAGRASSMLVEPTSPVELDTLNTFSSLVPSSGSIEVDAPQVLSAKNDVHSSGVPQKASSGGVFALTDERADLMEGEGLGRSLSEPYFGSVSGPYSTPVPEPYSTPAPTALEEGSASALVTDYAPATECSEGTVEGRHRGESFSMQDWMGVLKVASGMEGLLSTALKSAHVQVRGEELVLGFCTSKEIFFMDNITLAQCSWLEDLLREQGWSFAVRLSGVEEQTLKESFWPSFFDAEERAAEAEERALEDEVRSHAAVQHLLRCIPGTELLQVRALDAEPTKNKKSED
ncbi:MAG: hypothetical protein AAGJ35_04945, partial [Myxococcota bacterium]